MTKCSLSYLIERLEECPPDAGYTHIEYPIAFCEALNQKQKRLVELAFAGSMNMAIDLMNDMVPGSWLDIKIRGAFSHAELQTDEDFSYIAENVSHPASAVVLVVLRAYEDRA